MSLLTVSIEGCGWVASIKPNVAIWTAMIAAAATIIAAPITVPIPHDGGDGGGGEASSTPNRPLGKRISA